MQYFLMIRVILFSILTGTWCILSASDVALFKEQMNEVIKVRGLPLNDPVRVNIDEGCRKTLSRIFDSFLQDQSPEGLSQLLLEIGSQEQYDEFKQLIFCDLKVRKDPKERQRIVTAIMKGLSLERKYALMNSRIANDHDPEAYSAEVQDFIIDEIPEKNIKLRGYLVLSPENKARLVPYLSSQAAKLHEERGDYGNGWELVCAMLLAYDGHQEGVDALLALTLHDGNDFDLAYVPCAMGATGNQELLQKLGEFVLTRKEKKWGGADCMPQQRSFAFESAATLSVVVEGFPKVSFWEFFSQEQEQECEDFIKAHPDGLPIRKDYDIWDFWSIWRLDPWW